MSMRSRHHHELLAGLAQSTSQMLSGIEGERIVSLTEASRLAGVSIDTLKRRHGDKIVRMSEKRIGMRLRHVLGLAQPLDAA
jgi:hypothetical protein